MNNFYTYWLPEIYQVHIVCDMISGPDIRKSEGYDGSYPSTDPGDTIFVSLKIVSLKIESYPSNRIVSLKSYPSIVSLKSNRIEGYDLRDMIRLDLGIRFSYPSKSYPPNRIVSLKSYCIPQIVSLNRIPQIELYRGIRLRDTIEG